MKLYNQIKLSLIHRICHSIRLSFNLWHYSKQRSNFSQSLTLTYARPNKVTKAKTQGEIT